MGNLNQNTIMNLNLDGKGAVDMHAEALANNKGIKADGGMAQHDILKQRVRNAKPSTSSGNNFDEVKNSDEMYNHIMDMKKSGLLPQMLKRAGIKKNFIQEDDMGGAGGAAMSAAPAGGAGGGMGVGSGNNITTTGSEPIVGMNSGAMKKIDDCYNAMTCKKGE